MAQFKQVRFLLQDKLPEEVAQHMCEFVNPTRDDWKTCKIHETNLIKQTHEEIDTTIHNRRRGTKYYWKEEELDEIETWTITGKLIVSNRLKKKSKHSDSGYYWKALISCH
jgi:hypothetical protein